MSHVTENDRRIILASGSPRRLELCRQIGFEPIVVVSNIPEERASDESPAEYTRRLASDKGADVAEKLDGDADAPDWILSADTIVELDGDVLEKPADEDEAVEMLLRLSGREHQVITSFAWRSRATGRLLVRSSTANVWFRSIDESSARRYAQTGEPMDKAGAYGIQDLGGVFVDRIDGSFFTVVGLPIAEVVEALRSIDGLGPFPFRAD